MADAVYKNGQSFQGPLDFFFLLPSDKWKSGDLSRWKDTRPNLTGFSGISCPIFLVLEKVTKFILSFSKQALACGVYFSDTFFKYCPFSSEILKLLLHFSWLEFSFNHFWPREVFHGFLLNICYCRPAVFHCQSCGYTTHCGEMSETTFQAALHCV